MGKQTGGRGGSCMEKHICFVHCSWRSATAQAHPKWLNCVELCGILIEHPGKSIHSVFALRARWLKPLWRLTPPPLESHPAFGCYQAGLDVSVSHSVTDWLNCVLQAKLWHIKQLRLTLTETRLVHSSKQVFSFNSLTVSAKPAKLKFLSYLQTWDGFVVKIRMSEEPSWAL